jgi:hypothetical protein
MKILATMVYGLPLLLFVISAYIAIKNNHYIAVMGPIIASIFMIRGLIEAWENE